MKKKFFFIACLFFNFLLFVQVPSSIAKKNFLRIAVKKNIRSLTLTSKKKLTIIDKNNRSITYPSWSPIKISVSHSKLIVNGIVKKNPITIIPQNKHIAVNQKNYLGAVEVRVISSNKLLVINKIEIEDYLKGVLPNEVSPRWNLEALKAQAVIARTYALYQKEKKEGELYHLEATVEDQVYNGSSNETKQSNKAVDKTKGLVVTFNNALALTVYHSVCGGHTENAENIWVGRGAPYLKGKKCTYDKKAPRYRWETTLSLKEIQSKLNKNAYKIGSIKSIAPIIHTESGRIFRLEVNHSRGRDVLTGVDFRKILGYNKLRSTFFDIFITKKFALFKGRGSGHGAGLCQWGAKGMADAGFNYKQILYYYYPGVKVKRFSSL